MAQAECPEPPRYEIHTRYVDEDTDYFSIGIIDREEDEIALWGVASGEMKFIVERWLGYLRSGSRDRDELTWTPMR